MPQPQPMGGVLSTTPYGSGLERKRYLTMVLRLLLDQRGTLVHGEVVGLDGRIHQRFVDWPGMVRAVQAALENEQRRE